MEQSFWREFWQCWERDSEMGHQISVATYLRLSDCIKMQVLEIWENGKTVTGL